MAFSPVSMAITSCFSQFFWCGGSRNWALKTPVIIYNMEPELG